MNIFTKSFLIAVALFMSAMAEASAWSSGGSVTVGRTSLSSAGCSGSGCHGSSSTNTTVTRTGGSTTLNTGATTTFTIQVAHTNSNMSAAGVNIAVKTSESGTENAGTLSEDESGLQLLSSEVTHNTPKTMSGGTTTFTVSWTAPTTPGIYYLRAVGNAVNGNGGSNGDNWNWMTPVAITVSAQPSLALTAPTSTTSWCAGSTQNITWTSTGVANIKIEASPDGVNFLPVALSVPASTGSYSYSIPSNAPTGNQYRIRISDVSNANLSSTSSAFTIAGAPSITTQPQSQTGCAGQSASFSVGTATSTGNTYQWMKDGQQISGATTATYSISNLTAANAGRYTVVVTSCGTPVTSNEAVLTVNAATAITSQPTPSQTVCQNQSVTLTVAATGTNLSYQWKKDGNVLPGETSASLTVAVLGAQNAGSYTATVTGSCGTAQTTTPAVIDMRLPPSISSQPVSQTVVAGANISFAVVANDAVSYQWRKNGVDIANATTATLTLTNVKPSDAGDYDVRIVNNCGALASTVAKLTIGQAGIGAILNVESTVDFGTIKPTETVERTLTLTNTGDSVLQVSAITLGGAQSQNFSIMAGNAPFTIAPNATRAIVMQFTGSAVGAYTATVNFTSNSSTSPVVALNGVIAAAGAPALSANSMNFDTVIVNSKSVRTITISNTGSAPAFLLSAIISGQSQSQFRLVNPFSEMTLQPGGSIEIPVEFSPTVEGNATADLTFTGTGVTAVATLQGYGKLSNSIGMEINLQAFIIAPNPASEQVVITLTLQKAMIAEVQIADMSGNIIRTLQEMQVLAEGKNVFIWDRNSAAGMRSAAGMYHLLLRTESGMITLPIVLAD